MSATQDESIKGNRPEDAKLPLGKSFAYGLQHVLTMYGGIIAPPLIIGNAAGLAPDEIGLLVAHGSVLIQLSSQPHADRSVHPEVRLPAQPDIHADRDAVTRCRAHASAGRERALA